MIEQVFYKASRFVSVSTSDVEPAGTAIDTVFPDQVRKDGLGVSYRAMFRRIKGLVA